MSNENVARKKNSQNTHINIFLFDMDYETTLQCGS